MDTDDLHVALYRMGRNIPTELIRFGGALSDAEFLNDGWRYFLERPEKWSSEYAIWRDTGKPSEGDGAKWDEFCAKVDALETWA